MRQIAQKILLTSSTVVCCILTNNIAQAQISSDGTLPTPSNVNQINNVFEITGGTQAGNNLFHSLREFSIFNGSEAFLSKVLIQVISSILLLELQVDQFLILMD